MKGGELQRKVSNEIGEGKTNLLKDNKRTNTVMNIELIS